MSKTATPMCNDMECPVGFAPVDKAWEVECLDGKCGADQCCDLMCSSYACPDDHVLVEDAAYRLCVDDICTTQHCCDSSEEKGMWRKPKETPTDYSSTLLRLF